MPCTTCALPGRGGMRWSKGAQTKDHSSHFGHLGRGKGSGCDGFQGQGRVVVMRLRRSQTANVDTLQRWGDCSPMLPYLCPLVCPENGEFS